MAGVTQAVLGLDCATGGCAAALLRDGQVLASQSWPMERGQAAALAPLVAELLAQAGLAPADLGRIGITIGPGAFTGIRIGLAFARGLGLALKIPVIGVTVFEALAAARAPADFAPAGLLAAVDSRRAELFLQAYDAQGRPEGEPRALTPADALDQLGAGRPVMGDGGPAMAAAGFALAPGAGLPDPAVVAKLAAGRAADAHPAIPFYLRPPDTSRARAGRRIAT